MILGVKEGEHVSYADLSKGIHKYIKDHDLKNPSKTSTPTAPTPVVSSTDSSRAAVGVRTCRVCDAEIPANAVFCDLCGARQ
jgi:hypothetical protein